MGCVYHRFNGDKIFCPEHRDSWKDLCVKRGVYHRIISESEENDLLKEFCGRRLR